MIVVAVVVVVVFVGEKISSTSVVVVILFNFVGVLFVGVVGLSSPKCLNDLPCDRFAPVVGRDST